MNKTILANSIVLICVLLICLALIRCSPAVNRVYLLPEPLPPKPPGHPITLYLDKEPQCPYQEIGLVTSRQRNKLVSMDTVIESLRKEARKMGGDAVIHITLGDKAIGAVVSHQPSFKSSTVIVDHDPIVKGTIIKWLSEDCRE